ncbi:hypothetical protein CLTEP_23840 [Clostridium tepidiprofundi DSM 19306]|uniref:Uncharacterized protein n=1 Tax=Clostridium tepidiprofundi DSM 19306 TaxID=1121338 RepID=A0A151AUS4_9CLOT|nr:hypothetical protein CLTEP_23840 [Clostridium tepidiprofundi DSM 19306]
MRNISFEQFDRKFTEKKIKTQTKIENKKIYNATLKLSTKTP